MWGPGNLFFSIQRPHGEQIIEEKKSNLTRIEFKNLLIGQNVLYQWNVIFQKSCSFEIYY